MWMFLLGMRSLRGGFVSFFFGECGFYDIDGGFFLGCVERF